MEIKVRKDIRNKGFHFHKVPHGINSQTAMREAMRDISNENPSYSSSSPRKPSKIGNYVYWEKLLGAMKEYKIETVQIWR